MLQQVEVKRRYTAPTAAPTTKIIVEDIDQLEKSKKKADKDEEVIVFSEKTSVEDYIVGK